MYTMDVYIDIYIHIYIDYLAAQHPSLRKSDKVRIGHGDMVC